MFLFTRMARNNGTISIFVAHLSIVVLSLISYIAGCIAKRHCVQVVLLSTLWIYMHCFFSMLYVRNVVRSHYPGIGCITVTYHWSPFLIRLVAYALQVEGKHCDRTQYFWVLQPCPVAHSCIFLISLLPACRNVNRFVASSLFLYRVIFLLSYRILYRADGVEIKDTATTTIPLLH